MCTLSLIPFGPGLRLVMNRDELTTRSRALPPRVSPLADEMQAAWPIDPDSGGTWIGANSSGLMLALMNGNPSPPLPPPRDAVSRGTIIPDLARHANASEAMERFVGRSFGAFAPFRLVLADDACILSAVWDGGGMRAERWPARTACFVSSGLGDHRVAPRLTLFDEWIAQRGPSAEAQDAFHAHEWPDRPEISVRMRRPGARTVSVTTIEPREDRSLVMRYADDDGAREVTLPPRMLEPGRAG